jgi:CRP-like cAMP-binding protein
VTTTVLSNQGKEAVVAMLGNGQFFGEGCLAGQTHRMASVTALTECTIARLEKRVVVKVLHDEPAFSTLFISYLLALNVRMEADLVDQLFNSSEKRLASRLTALRPKNISSLSPKPAPSNWCYSITYCPVERCYTTPPTIWLISAIYYRLPSAKGGKHGR